MMTSRLLISVLEVRGTRPRRFRGTARTFVSIVSIHGLENVSPLASLKGRSCCVPIALEEGPLLSQSRRPRLSLVMTMQLRNHGDY